MHPQGTCFSTNYYRRLLFVSLALLTATSFATTTTHAAERKPTIADLVKLQNPGFYKQLEELKKSGEHEAAAAVIDIPNGYISNVFTTGAGYIGQTYVVYYPEGGSALLAHANWGEPGDPIEFFEHRAGKMVKVKSLLPDLDCAALSSDAARDYAYKLVKRKDWLKEFRVIYELPQTGTKIAAYCSFEEDWTTLEGILQESKVESSKFHAARENGGPLSGLFSVRTEFRWDKKSGTFSRVK